MRQYSEIELDALKEFVNVGTANAATALSKLVDRTIAVNVPVLKLAPIADVPELLGGAETPIVGLYFKITGGITGSILVFFPKESAVKLVDFLTANIVSEDSPDYALVKQSAMMELGNILTNSFLNALSSMIGENLYLSVPFFSEDYLGAVIDVLLINISQVADYALLMDTLIQSPDLKSAGSFIVFPDTESLDKIFKKLGV